VLKNGPQNITFGFKEIIEEISLVDITVSLNVLKFVFFGLEIIISNDVKSKND
jgi:hypothetical protein